MLYVFFECYQYSHYTWTKTKSLPWESERSSCTICSDAGNAEIICVCVSLYVVSYCFIITLLMLMEILWFVNILNVSLLRLLSVYYTPFPFLCYPCPLSGNRISCFLPHTSVNSLTHTTNIAYNSLNPQLCVPSVSFRIQPSRGVRRRKGGGE